MFLQTESMGYLEELAIHHLIWRPSLNKGNMADEKLLDDLLQETIFRRSDYLDQLSEMTKPTAKGLPDKPSKMLDVYKMKRKFSLKLLIQFKSLPLPGFVSPKLPNRRGICFPCM